MLFPIYIKTHPGQKRTVTPRFFRIFLGADVTEDYDGEAIMPEGALWEDWPWTTRSFS